MRYMWRVSLVEILAVLWDILGNCCNEKEKKIFCQLWWKNIWRPGLDLMNSPVELLLWKIYQVADAFVTAEKKISKYTTILHFILHSRTLDYYRIRNFSHSPFFNKCSDLFSSDRSLRFSKSSLSVLEHLLESLLNNTTTQNILCWLNNNQQLHITCSQLRQQPAP